MALPLRHAISTLDRSAVRDEARAHFGLTGEAPVLLVFGGSQGAMRLNSVVAGALPALRSHGIEVLHAFGGRNDPPAASDGYVPVPFIERMDLAYAAADLALTRAGAMTCAELAAVGLPAVYVPLPIGNGEQRINALPVVEAGGGLLIDDAQITAEWLTATAVDVLHDGDRLQRDGCGRVRPWGAGRRRAAGPHRHAGGIGRWTMTEPASLGRVHIVGIGGAGMSGIARIMVAQGVQVSGSDAKDSRRLQALRAVGVDARVGHDAALVADIDTLVVSTAIPESNVERAAARDSGIRELSRAEALAAVMAGSRGVAVSGTHGKTTTTSMLTVALQHCGVDPSFAIGSELNESGSNAHLGTGEVFVVEADESDGAFLHLAPVAAIVTNVEADHLDHWGTYEAIEQGFLEFATGIRDRDGFVVVCVDDLGGARLALRAREAGVDVRTYGESVEADYRLSDARLTDTGWAFDTVHNGVRLGEIELKVPGKHNALNAQAAFVTGLGLDYPASDLRAGLESFSGTRRRFDFKGQVGQIRVFDDYAHHPTEIEATLRAARDVVGGGRLVVAFQAHHYYRTAMFVEEFGAALGPGRRGGRARGLRAGGDADPGRQRADDGGQRPAAGRAGRLRAVLVGGRRPPGRPRRPGRHHHDPRRRRHRDDRPRGARPAARARGDVMTAPVVERPVGPGTGTAAGAAAATALAAHRARPARCRPRRRVRCGPSGSPRCSPPRACGSSGSRARGPTPRSPPPPSRSACRWPASTPRRPSAPCARCRGCWPPRCAAAGRARSSSP